MVDTARSLTEIQTLLADNTSGAISPQDVRDMLLSVVHARGEIAITSSAETSILLVDTWYPVAGTWTLTTATSGEGFDMSTNGQLRYTGTPDRIVFVNATVSFESAVAAKTFEFALAVDGTVIDESIASHYGSGPAVPLGFAAQALLSLSTNQYMTLMVRNRTDDTNLTVMFGAVVADGSIK
jgi:hypothetical protein